MENVQPKNHVESSQMSDTFPSEALPRLSLPQVVPAQVSAKLHHTHGVTTQSFQSEAQITPFPQTPMTPLLTEHLTVQSSVLQTKKNVSSLSLLSGPQVPFPTPRLDFSRSLRSGITYIPRSMTRHKEPTMADALIACGTLVLMSLFILMLLYYFSM
jgi:hypothetical protein